MWNGNSFDYNDSVFSVRHHGSVSGSVTWNGIFGGADGAVRDWNGRHKNFVDLWIFSAQSYPVFPVYFLSGIVAHYDRNAGNLLSVCAQTLCWRTKDVNRANRFINNIRKNNTLLW